MTRRKTLLAVVGSASQHSSNHKLVALIQRLTADEFDWAVFPDLKTLPHFDPNLSLHNPPDAVIALRDAVQQADGVLICTPEYVFSIPSGVKNAIEWCVATTVFDGKPAGLITASAHGQKGHEELQLLMSTLSARFTPETTLLIQAIKGKLNEQGELTDPQTIQKLTAFVDAFRQLMNLGQSSQ